MRNTRLPVSLKDATWIITDRVSITNTPPMMTSTSLLTDDHGNGAQRRTQRQRADVAHEHHGRVGVEPQKAQTRHRRCAAQNTQFTSPERPDIGHRTGNVANLTLPDIGEDAQRAADQHGRQHRQTIETVGQIDRIAGADDHRNRPAPRNTSTPSGMATSFEQRHDERVVSTGASAR